MNYFIGGLLAMSAIGCVSDGSYGWATLCAVLSLMNVWMSWADDNIMKKGRS